MGLGKLKALSICNPKKSMGNSGLCTAPFLDSRDHKEKHSAKDEEEEVRFRCLPWTSGYAAAQCFFLPFSNRNTRQRKWNLNISTTGKRKVLSFWTSSFSRKSRQQKRLTSAASRQQPGDTKKQHDNSMMYKHGNGKFRFLIGNTSSFRVHSPASYVSLPECISIQRMANWCFGARRFGFVLGSPKKEKIGILRGQIEIPKQRVAPEHQNLPLVDTFSGMCDQNSDYLLYKGDEILASYTYMDRNVPSYASL